jgi:MOSC domain-containing protein YiiM
MMEKGTIKELLDYIPQIGKVEWIGVRPEKFTDLQAVAKVMASSESGLEGDHFKSKRSKKRQVTLIQKEHLAAVGMILGKGEINPQLTRRNIVVIGINLLALKDREFKVGQAVLKCTGYCHPCSRMETNLGPGGYNAMRGHGGITAEVIESGEIALGDNVQLMVNLPSEQSSSGQ